MSRGPFERAALLGSDEVAHVTGWIRRGASAHLDGVKITDEYFNNLVVSPSVDAIQEFKIQKTLYPVEFGGKASGGIRTLEDLTKMAAAGATRIGASASVKIVEATAR